jgi:UDP-N-acetylmuramoylalanine--D-glutamate ligase
VGLGATGISCIRYLSALGHELGVVDTRGNPPQLEALRRDYPAVQAWLGEFDETVLERFDQVVVSPGLPMDMPLLQAVAQHGLPRLSDIDLFAAAATAPIIAVTGSNGKSTVTSMLRDMIQEDGREVRAGGNLGTPALDLLQQSEPDFYLLELSSFQLQRSGTLRTCAATVLNISPDHLDQHRSFDEYLSAKARIFDACEHPVVNRDDPVVAGMLPGEREHTSFGLDRPRGRNLGLCAGQGGTWLCRGETRLMDVAAMQVLGQHNLANALAALALGSVIGLSDAAMVRALGGFQGLAHRMQRVREADGVVWIDDSKGTNVGATVAAVKGLQGSLVLIAGGLSKGQDFQPLAAALAGRAVGIVLLGRDADRLAEQLRDVAPIALARDMLHAVALAAEMAPSGSTVLLSPACASQDMFRDYAHRGQVFADAARGLS